MSFVVCIFFSLVQTLMFVVVRLAGGSGMRVAQCVLTDFAQIRVGLGAGGVGWSCNVSGFIRKFFLPTSDLKQQ